MNIDKIRKEYSLGTLHNHDLDRDPFSLFRIWLNDAITSGEPEPTAMVLSTISPAGEPQSRVVLLKSLDDKGFTFYTNYMSQKGISIGSNPVVSLLFFWPQLQRQVRVSGKAGKVSRKETAEYFSGRPQGSRIGAWASDQSREIPSREYLEERFSEITGKYEGKDIPPPPHWGGYRVIPVSFEFWQGRESRLHDRFLFRKTAKGWKSGRLAP